MLGDKPLSFDEVVGILRRRMWWILIPMLISPVIGYLISLKLKPRYTSQALVLVEQQKVPDKFVTPVITEQLNVRLATMQEQILSRTRLQPIIDRFGLFRERIGKVPNEELVEELRKAVNVSPIRGDAANRGGLPGFYISFTSDNPRLAQQVCAEILAMFMQENLKLREQRAQGTTDFLSNQLELAKSKLDESDAKLADFKKKFMGQLPSDEPRNIQMLNTLTQQLGAANQGMEAARQKKALQESVLAQNISNWQMTQNSSGSGNPVDLQRQIEAVQARLIELQGRYTEDHPDVIRAKNQLEALKKQLDQPRSAPPKGPTQHLNEPPEIAQVRVALRMTEEDIRVRTADQQRLQREISNVQGRLQLSPTVEEQYKAVTRDYDNSLQFYNELLTKRTQSEMATNLEKQQQGEQFRVMDPPNLPEVPTYPNRPAFAGGGLGLGLMLGLGLAVLLELRTSAFRTEGDVEFYLRLPVLALMPMVGPSQEGKTSSAGRLRFLQRLRRKQPERQEVGA